MTTSAWQKLSWTALAIVLVAIFVIGSQKPSGPPSVAQHVRRLAAGIRCPTCSGQSAADSDAPASQAIRIDIEHRIAAGQSDTQIRAFMVSRYGTRILLDPPRSGVAGLVWYLPVVAFVVAVGAVAAAFRRWRRWPARQVTPADRAIVDAALGNAATTTSEGDTASAATPPRDTRRTLPRGLSAHQDGGVELLVDPQRADRQNQPEENKAPTQPEGQPPTGEDADNTAGGGNNRTGDKGHAEGEVHHTETTEGAVQVDGPDAEDGRAGTQGSTGAGSTG